MINKKKFKNNLLFTFIHMIILKIFLILLKLILKIINEIHVERFIFVLLDLSNSKLI